MRQYKKGGVEMKEKKERMEIEDLIIRYYKSVRNMPFKIRLAEQNYYIDLTYTKNYRNGSCTTKHNYLGSLCEQLGLKIFYLTYSFYWKDLEVDWPDSIIESVQKMPLAYHLAISVQLNGEKVFLDATFDPPLKKAGFIVNEMGRKLTNTKNAVAPCKPLIVHTNALKRDSYMKKIKANKKVNKEKIDFYTALNIWLSQIRTKNRADLSDSVFFKDKISPTMSLMNILLWIYFFYRF